MLVGASGGAGAWPAAALEAVADGVGFGEMAAAEGGSGAWGRLDGGDGGHWCLFSLEMRLVVEVEVKDGYLPLVRR